jgi:hypothetical protein
MGGTIRYHDGIEPLQQVVCRMSDSKPGLWYVLGDVRKS